METSKDSPSTVVPPLPDPLRSTNPLHWLQLFGPGAIIASLTIGTGELIFSSRGGALFGYRILFLFAAICFGKWVLAFTTARHMVLSGIHPLQRWMDLPLGPRGWLPVILFMLAAVCIPIWVSFHASVLGELVAELTGTRSWAQGASVHAWGALLVVSMVVLALTGGYGSLERIQLIIVVCMLLAMLVALLLLRPDWVQMLYGLCLPQPLRYPEWLLSDTRPEMQKIARHSEWVEATLYVGVIGGGGYDYLAYTSFLRDKGWGMAQHGGVTCPLGERRGLLSWVRAPLIDCTLSFLAVIVFSGVFVASGALLLGPQHQLPSDQSFLEHQSQFVTRVHPWLYPLYIVGVFLTMLGTLYGTLEVAPTIFRESGRAIGGPLSTKQLRSPNDGRVWSILWCGVYSLVVLGICFLYQWQGQGTRPPGLTSVLIPANLFTGVFLCGVTCLCNPWMDRCLPRELRLSPLLVALNYVVGCLFVAIAIKGAWDQYGLQAVLIFMGTIITGCIAAAIWNVRRRDPRS